MNPSNLNHLTPSGTSSRRSMSNNHIPSSEATTPQNSVSHPDIIEQITYTDEHYLPPPQLSQNISDIRLATSNSRIESDISTEPNTSNTSNINDNNSNEYYSLSDHYSSDDDSMNHMSEDSFHRGEELSNLIEYIQYHPRSTEDLAYANEDGHGHGVTREIYTEAFKQIKTSPLLHEENESGALHVNLLPETNDNLELRKKNMSDLDNIGRVMASLYLRIKNEQDIISQSHFSDKIYRAIDTLRKMPIRFNDNGEITTSNISLIIIFETIWQKQLSSPETTANSTANENHSESIVKQCQLEDAIAPLAALANGFNLFISLANILDTEITIDSLKNTFKGMTLREAVLTRSMADIFKAECNFNRGRGEPGTTKKRLEGRAISYMQRYLTQDPGVSEDDIKALNQFITAEQYINDKAIIKIFIVSYKPNTIPYPRARTCFRSLNLTEHHLENYEVFKSFIQSAIIQNGYLIARGD